MRIGEIRARAIRLSQYASIGTLISSVAIALKVGAFDWLWVVFGSLVLIAAAVFDPKVYKGEIAYSNKNNEEWRKAYAMIEEILNRTTNEETK